MKCPKCGSDQWKMASLIHAEGTSEKEGLILGGGTGLLSDGSGTSAGLGITRQTAQTKLAALAAPPTVEPMPSVKQKSPAANKKAIRGLIGIAMSIIAIVVSEALKISNLLTILGITVGMLYSMAQLLQAIFLLLFGAEANEYRKEKAASKLAFQQKCAKAMDQYKRTQVCMRCGHFYVPELHN